MLTKFQLSSILFGRTPTSPHRIWEQKQDDITADSHDNTFASNRGEREVTRAGVKLDPRWNKINSFHYSRVVCNILPAPTTKGSTAFLFFIGYWFYRGNRVYTAP